jgi:carbon starvation protein
MGRFLTLLLGEKHLLFAITFGAMAFSTFVFDTLDVATRLGRYILQELTGKKGVAAAVFATLLTVGIPAAFILAAKEGAWLSFWVLFGTSNQLLAALTLLGVSVWLFKSGRPFWFTLIPMLFVMTITFWSLVKQIQAPLHSLRTTGTLATIPLVNAVAAVLLFLLALFVVADALVSLKKSARSTGESAA